MKKIKVLVTGAGGFGHKGFIASHMVKFLKKKKQYEIYESKGDLRDYQTVLKQTKGMDQVYSFAADMGGIGYFSEQNYHPPINNFLIDINILRACEENKVKRIFYPSSACAYPMNLMDQGYDLTENLINYAAEPDQMYGWEKLTMLKLMRNSPIDCRVGILHTVYGPGQEYEGERAKFPPQMTFKVLKSKYAGYVTVWGDGKQTRTFLYIDDAIKKIYNHMENPKNIGEVNIGSDKEVSVSQIVNLLCRILKIKPTIIYDIDKPVGPVRRRCSNKKYNKIYGKLKETSLKDGFTNIINYIKQNERQTI